MAASSPDQQSGAPASQQHPSTQHQAHRPRPNLFRLSRKQAIWMLGVLLAVIGIIIAVLQVLGNEGHLPKLGADIASAVSGVCLFVFAFIPILISLLQSETDPSTPSPVSSPATAPQIERPQSVSAPQQQSRVTEEETSTPLHIESVFLVGAPLPSMNEFYGRLDERTTLFDRARKGYSTSIVGPRRIGKTWLISFLQFAIADEFGAKLRTGYIDATRPSCATPAGFTACALEALDMPVPATMRAHVDLTTLEETLKDLRARQEMPVLCIDEFENFGDHAAFDLHFFSALRSLAGPGLGLCLVVASKSPLIEIVGDIGKTSGFFNILEQVTLKPFNSEEAEEFIQRKGKQAGFDEQECDYLRTSGREYGAKGAQWPPLRLQIAGAMLERDKKLAAAGHPGHYRPAEVTYWKEFEERLEEKYRGMVKA